MKKFKSMIAALALGALTLSGCSVEDLMFWKKFGNNEQQQNEDQKQDDKKDDQGSGDQGGDVSDVVNVLSVSLNHETATLEIGDALQLEASILPTNATNKNVTWSATGDGIVSVDDGLVTALAAGTSVVTVKTVDGNKTDSCTITVNEAVTPVNIAYSTEADKAVNTWVFWNDQNWCGSNVTVNTHSKLGNTLTFAYTVEGNCDFGFQVFYKNGSLNEGASYRLTAKINSLVAGTVKLNGTYIDLVAGDNNVAVKYVEGGATASSFQLVVPTSMGNNTFVISDYAWEGILDIPGAVVVDADLGTISFSAVDGAASYLVKYYQSDANKTYIDEESVAASGASLTKLASLAFDILKYGFVLKAKSRHSPPHIMLEISVATPAPHTPSLRL